MILGICIPGGAFKKGLEEIGEAEKGVCYLNADDGVSAIHGDWVLLPASSGEIVGKDHGRAKISSAEGGVEMGRATLPARGYRRRNLVVLDAGSGDWQGP